jgi:hypothetical protein
MRLVVFLRASGAGFFSMGQMLEQVWKIRENLGFDMFPTCFNPSQKFGLKKMLYSQFSRGHVILG